MGPNPIAQLISVISSQVQKTSELSSEVKTLVKSVLDILEKSRDTTIRSDEKINQIVERLIEVERKFEKFSDDSKAENRAALGDVLERVVEEIGNIPNFKEDTKQAFKEVIRDLHTDKEKVWKKLTIGLSIALGLTILGFILVLAFGNQEGVLSWLKVGTKVIGKAIP